MINGITPPAVTGSSTFASCPGTSSYWRYHPNVLIVAVLALPPGWMRKTTGAVRPGGTAMVTSADRPPIVQKPVGSGYICSLWKNILAPGYAAAESTTGTCG